ncbi:beta-lactamase superfamily domain-containing protein [Sordaria brevicollis]|uniref:Beta-lactamase superfamily domain-containing protein n=1 Tax=Sordaria brevicollis TaxID=83679 RepID=A0AAE0UB16_SORBR|nr:beta-lactamase superfamily domain-containing protein [Sordaria brevicollis]
MPSPKASFAYPLSITNIGTATALIHLGEPNSPSRINIITDPVFSPGGTIIEYRGIVINKSDSPALALDQLPPIDAVLLSHEDHPDNLDELGRRLLDGRKVFTTMDGASQLAPRPGVRGLKNWETVGLDLGGEGPARKLEVTATPCKHLPGGEVVGFIISSPDGAFGTHRDGRPNAIYFSGDTIHLEELGKMKGKYHIAVAMLNIGKATVSLPGGGADGGGSLQITMGGEQAAQLAKDIGADVIVPLHFESWSHFRESAGDLANDFVKAGVEDKVLWLKRGVESRIA